MTPLLHLTAAKLVLLVAGRLQIDKVVEPGSVDGDTEVGPAHAATGIGLESPSGRLLESGVADLELLCGDVRPIGEQLLGGRRARGARAVEAEA